jgi:hypothetical protein
MLNLHRFRIAAKISGIHFLCSVVVASVAAWIVFGIWYTYPYHELSGGRELFLLLICVDVICGPLLTFILFNPKKSRKELILDLGLITFIQIGAMIYGMGTVWQARPLYLVHEVDRYKVISASDTNAEELKALPANLKPQFWAGPKTVGIRPPKNAEEHNKVLFDAATGGRDYAARPEFYVPYLGEVVLIRAKPLDIFLQKYPDQQGKAAALAKEKNADLAKWLYLPVVARQDWVAILDQQGEIQGFLKGDGF